MEENLAKVESQLTKGQKIYAGCYMHDYGDCKEMPVETPMAISTDQFITREELKSFLKN